MEQRPEQQVPEIALPAGLVSCEAGHDLDLGVVATRWFTSVLGGSQIMLKTVKSPTSCLWFLFELYVYDEPSRRIS